MGFFSRKPQETQKPRETPAKKTDLGRNDPCHCGSGKKYKKCHEEKDAAAQHAILEKQWKEGEKAAAKKAEEEKATIPAQSNSPPKPTHQPHISGHRRNTMTVPKFNMPRKT